MSKFDNLAKQITAIGETVDPLSITKEEFRQLSHTAIQLCVDAEFTAKDYDNARDASIVTQDWDFGVRVHPPHKTVGEHIASVSQTSVEETHNAEGMAVLRFTGFVHDVALAMLLMELLVLACEKEWADTTATTMFKMQTKSGQVVMRGAHHRAWAARGQDFFVRESYERQRSEMKDPDKDAAAAMKFFRLRRYEFKNPASAV